MENIVAKTIEEKIIAELENLSTEKRDKVLQEILNLYWTETPIKDFGQRHYSEGYFQGEMSDYVFEKCSQVVGDEIDNILTNIEMYEGSIDEWLESNYAKYYCHHYLRRIKRFKAMVEKEIQNNTAENNTNSIF